MVVAKCAHVWTHMYGLGFTCVCACICRPEINFGISFSITLHLGFLRQGLSLNPELTVLARRTGQQLPRIFYFFFSSTGASDTCGCAKLFYESSCTYTSKHFMDEATSIASDTGHEPLLGTELGSSEEEQQALIITRPPLQSPT